ncbi:uncharacterized protein LOC134828020 [Culicoides brevitarsis]|uniref:uncharacterized protein LOC134828020 n=1 Tax=Culicoides brevitarsis TaxID=469753 RepID=UPI00307B4AB9
MKPITFDVIRNLLKTKKKGKEKGIDQSFKRSDSFKRISIRKSYLDRGRRKAVLRSKTVLDLNDIEIKSTSSSLERRNNKSRDASPDEDFSSQEPSIIAELERKDASIDEKIRALQEINDRYMRENQKAKYVERKSSAIPKPPRNSKLKERSEKKQTQAKVEKIRENEAISKENSICDKTNDLTRSSKTVSQINILFTGETNTDSLATSDKRHSNHLEDDQTSFYSVSTFTLDSQAYQNTASTRHSNYSRSISYSQAMENSKQEQDSFLTFTTYCQSTKSDTNENKKNLKGKYLETSFDGPTDTNTTRSNTEQGSKLVKNTKNISTTSLVYEPTYVKPVINTQTFKMVKSKSREGVIIRIPAVENDKNDQSKRQSSDENDEKDRLNRQSSNDSAVEADSNSSVEKLNQIQEKSTINATITYEKICKAFEKQEAKYKKNPKKDKRKDTRRERLESHLSQKPLKDKQEVLSDEGLIASTESLEISSPKNGTFDLKSPRHSMLDLPSINCTDTYDKTTSEKFTFPKDYFEEENNISYRVDSNDVESPEGIAIPLKIKENPFTKHKEISAVNTSRIWKQVNLGQEEEIISTNPLPMPPAPQQQLRPKNESFKSMSSHDSGFSLTLTKPKNLFRRKSKKQRRKPKLSVSRDGYFKRVMVVQHNSTKRKKNNKKQRPQGKDVFKALYDDNWTKLGGNYADQVLSENDYENQSILRDFENFCNRNKHFNKEINDLEEFYEEHLKRLKHYYLQRKQMNEVAIREFYRDYANDEEFYDAHIVSRNDTFRFKCKKSSENGRDSPEYLFPYPDKRIALGKKRSKMQFPEVRTFKSHILGTKYSEIASARNETLENLRSNKDFNQFPYWKLSRKVSRRERVAPKFKDRFVDPFETEKNEVSLADIFPSVNDEIKPKHDIASDSDEFSEQEFIANCLGGDLYCSTCDKNNSDCECYTDDEAGQKKKTNAKNTMKSLKRRRSKKRVRKNHSTLRRDYFYEMDKIRRRRETS